MSGHGEHESHAGIVAEIRARAWAWMDDKLKQYDERLADRLEAAYRRERGDSAKLREALEYMFMLIDGRHLVLECETTEEISGVQCKLAEARAALAAPPRNCDVYNSETCRMAYHLHGDGLMTMQAFADWLFAPATEKEGGSR